VAEQAGVPMDTVSERFGSRMELLSAVARRLYLSVFPFEKDPVRPNDLRAFLEAYLAVQGEPKARLLRQLGDLLASDRLDGRDAAYWHVVGEIELRLVAAGLEGVVAHRRSLVIAPALALMARRASFELAMPGDISDFIDAACHLALGDSGDG
jgi:AcrR family transcriptional regulator